MKKRPIKTPLDLLTGSIFPTKHSGLLEIIEYFNGRKVLIKFAESGYTRICQASHIRRGQVKDAFAPRVHGVGYFGKGLYVANKNGKDSSSYKCWVGMLERCYSKKQRHRNTTYADCTVAEVWHNYQQFASWYDDNYPQDGLKYQLDKDKLVEGNRIYSPEACMFFIKPAKR